MQSSNLQKKQKNFTDHQLQLTRTIRERNRCSRSNREGSWFPNATWNTLTLGQHNSAKTQHRTRRTRTTATTYANTLILTIRLNNKWNNEDNKNKREKKEREGKRLKFLESYAAHFWWQSASCAPTSHNLNHPKPNPLTEPELILTTRSDPQKTHTPHAHNSRLGVTLYTRTILHDKFYGFKMVENNLYRAGLSNFPLVVLSAAERQQRVGGEKEKEREREQCKS